MFLDFMECAKCGHDSDKNRIKKGKALCEVCRRLSPDEDKAFEDYVSEKVDKSSLEPFRKYLDSDKKKKAMMKMATKGNLMSRAPFGYDIEAGRLVPAQNSMEVTEIFEEFLDKDASLRQIAEKHKLSVNGLKKVLRNFTYIGKIKFGNQVYEGSHNPILSNTLFNHVQNKMERMGIK